MLTIEEKPTLQTLTLGTSYAAIVGQMLKQLREHYGINQVRIADTLGVSLMTISRIEKGDTVMDVPQLIKISEVFGVDPQAFIEEAVQMRQRIEKDGYTVLQNKQELDRQRKFAALSAESIAGYVSVSFLMRIRPL